MVEKLLQDIENITQQTPLIRSDKRRKESIYRQCKERCKYYLDLATQERNSKLGEFNRPSETEIMIHLLSHCISWSEFTASLTSEEYSDMILTACRMAYNSEVKHGQTNNNE